MKIGILFFCFSVNLFFTGHLYNSRLKIKYHFASPIMSWCFKHGELHWHSRCKAAGWSTTSFNMTGVGHGPDVLTSIYKPFSLRHEWKWRFPSNFPQKIPCFFANTKKTTELSCRKKTRRKWWTSSTVHWVFAVPPQQGSSCWRWVTWQKLKRLPCLESIKHKDPNVPNVWMVYLHDRWKMATWPRGNI